jgi:hypothetical protein
MHLMIFPTITIRLTILSQKLNRGQAIAKQVCTLLSAITCSRICGAKQSASNGDTTSRASNGDPAALKMTEQEFALLNRVTEQDFSKGVTKFLRMAQLPPSLALKSDEAKFAYGRCRT